MAGIADTTTTSANAPAADKIRSVKDGLKKGPSKRQKKYLDILSRHGG